jgi:hypothetical protein
MYGNTFRRISTGKGREMKRHVKAVRVSLLLIAVLLVLPSPSANAGGYGRTATFYSDGTFSCIVGQTHYPELGCENDGYQEWGTTSDYRHMQVYDMCGQPVSENCEQKVNGV